MSDKITVEFETQKRSEIPRIGACRAVRVNGRVERKYIGSLKVEAFKQWGEGIWFRGTYTLEEDLWQ